MKKKILIIGSSGKIGIDLINNLIHRNLVFTFNNNPIKDGIKFSLEKDDIEDKLNLNTFDSVIFLSALSNPSICFENPKYSELINVINTKKVLKKIIKLNKHIIFFSSEYIYDGKKGNYEENNEANPILLYGKQKLEIENFLKNETDNFTILRIAKTYGSVLNDRTLFTNWLNQLSNNNVKEVKCAFDQYFSPIFSLDLVKILDFFLLNNIKGIYNVGGPKTQSRLDCLNTLIKIFKIQDVIIKKCSINDFNLSEKMPLNISFNTQKLSNTINFELNDINSFCKNILYKKYAKN